MHDGNDSENNAPTKAGSELSGELGAALYPDGSPGSPEAKEKGCKCPVLDNGHGRGSGMTDDEGKPMFWIVVGCPLHDPQMHGRR